MNVPRLLEAAEAHLAKGRDAAAEKLYMEALEHPATTARAAGGLGAIALRAGDVGKAHELFGQALALNPENAELLVGLAAVHLASAREEAAQTCLRRAMRLDPSLPTAPANLALVLLTRRDLDGAHALARRAVDLAPNSADIVLSLANIEMLRGEIGAAYAQFEKAAELAPDRADGPAGLGILHQLTGDSGKAVEYLERARLLEPDAPSILARLAECRAALGEFEAAQRLIRQAVAVAPADVEVRNAQGVVLMNSGRYAEALASLRLAARYDPRSSAPLVNLALLMRRVDQDEAARAAARQAIALGEGGSLERAARRIEIDVLCRSGKWQEAWRRFDDMKAGDGTPGRLASSPDETGLEFGPRVALLVDDLPCALTGLRLLPRLAGVERSIRLLCLPAYAGFFRSIPGIDTVEARTAVDLARDIEPGETALLLDELPRLLRATPACLTPLELNLGETPPDAAATPTARNASPYVGLWWEDTPGGPDPQMLLEALPGIPGLLREPGPGQSLALADGRAPSVLIDQGVRELADMARVLLSLDLVVAVDSAVAHLAANLGCRTVVICQLDVPWYWSPCGPKRTRWYPTARAVARAPGGLRNTLANACENLLSGTDGRGQTAEAGHA